MREITELANTDRAIYLSRLVAITRRKRHRLVAQVHTPESENYFLADFFAAQ
jgi:hypothetical protein